MEHVEPPINSNDRYLYGINVRLDALIDMMSSFLEVYAKQNALATSDNKVEEVIPFVEKVVPLTKTRRKRGGE